MQRLLVVLTAIALAVAVRCGVSAVSATHEVDAFDRDSDCTSDGPADGTILSVFIPRDNPCADAREELVSTHWKRESQAILACLAAAGLAIAALTRSPRDKDRTLPPARVC
ncbi:MAG TPA: hypothetical protein VGM90_25610 [Kofleriaceae bacterium]|jgi:hypothetical protein